MQNKLMQMVYPNNPDRSVFLHRAAFGRSLAKRIGALEQPSRGMYLLTSFGKELLALPEEQALDKIYKLHSEHQKKQRETAKTADSFAPEKNLEEDESPAENHIEVDDDDPGTEWKTRLLKRLHQLSPDGFEKFVIYLLRRYGLELAHLGGSGDEGLDEIGTAPLSLVLSSRVAVQVKRYDPHGKPIGR